MGNFASALGSAFGKMFNPDGSTTAPGQTPPIVPPGMTSGSTPSAPVQSGLSRVKGMVENGTPSQARQSQQRPLLKSALGFVGETLGGDNWREGLKNGAERRMARAYAEGDYQSMAAEAAKTGDYEMAEYAAQIPQLRREEQLRRAQVERQEQTREAAETATFFEHMERAIQLDPNITAESFILENGDLFQAITKDDPKEFLASLPTDLNLDDPAQRRILTDKARMAGGLGPQTEAEREFFNAESVQMPDGSEVMIQYAKDGGPPKIMQGTTERPEEMSPYQDAMLQMRWQELQLKKREAESQGSAYPEELMKMELSLGGKWDTVQNNMNEINGHFDRILSLSEGEPSSADDLALVVAFTKMLDPGSVAREGEVALTQSASGVLAEVANLQKKWVNGKTTLPDQTRKSLVAAAKKMYPSYAGAYENVAVDYHDQTRTYGGQPAHVMKGYRVGGSQGRVDRAAQISGTGSAGQAPAAPAVDPEQADWSKFNLYDEVNFGGTQYKIVGQRPGPNGEPWQQNKDNFQALGSAPKNEADDDPTVAYPNGVTSSYMSQYGIQPRG